MFLEHVYYLDRIDISTLAKGVKNSLHKNILSWENIDANEFVLQAINLFLPELLTETLSGKEFL
jgi:predicted aspartyl protease